MEKELLNLLIEYSANQAALRKEFSFQLDCVAKKCCKKYKRGKRCKSCPNK